MNSQLNIESLSNALCVNNIDTNILKQNESLLCYVHSYI